MIMYAHMCSRVTFSYPLPLPAENSNWVLLNWNQLDSELDQFNWTALVFRQSSRKKFISTGPVQWDLTGLVQQYPWTSSLGLDWTQFTLVMVQFKTKQSSWDQFEVQLAPLPTNSVSWVQLRSLWNPVRSSSKFRLDSNRIFSWPPLNIWIDVEFRSASSSDGTRSAVGQFANQLNVGLTSAKTSCTKR